MQYSTGEYKPVANKQTYGKMKHYFCKLSALFPSNINQVVRA
jgi:hypothetical protein